MLARARTCTCGRVSDTSSYACRREPWLRCAPTSAGAYFWARRLFDALHVSCPGGVREAPPEGIFEAVGMMCSVGVWTRHNVLCLTRCQGVLRSVPLIDKHFQTTMSVWR